MSGDIGVGVIRVVVFFVVNVVVLKDCFLGI